MKLENVTVPFDAVPLAALHYVPENVAVQDIVLIYAHGFTSSRHSMDGLASYLALRAYEGYSFDAPGHKLGATGGRMDRMAQAADALDVMREYVEKTAGKPVVLIGHSMGGAASVAVAARVSQRRAAGVGSALAGFVCVAVGTEPAHGFTQPLGKTMLVQRADYVAGTEARTLLTELDALVLQAEHIRGVPSLFIAARQDILISPDRVERLAVLAGSASPVAVVDSTHQDAPDRSRAAIISWLFALTSS